MKQTITNPSRESVATTSHERDHYYVTNATGQNLLSRRTLLQLTGAAGATMIAGCADIGPDLGSEPTDGEGGGGDGDTGDGDSDSGGGPPDTGTVGQTLDGELVRMMIEYVRPVEGLTDYRRFPYTDKPETYGEQVTVEDLIDVGLANPGSSLYGIGIAVVNDFDEPISVRTVGLQNEGEGPVDFGTFLGQSQRLTYAHGRTGGHYIAPGELIRGEVVFALDTDPSEFTLLFMPHRHIGGPIERFTVDLRAGSERQADFALNPATLSIGETGDVGDLEVTLHSAEYVDSVTESPNQHLFGPREGYRYLLVDLSATRRGEVMIGQRWEAGAVDDEGYGFAWTTSYQDVMDITRPSLDDLSIDESISHTQLAFPVEDGFAPEYFTLTAPGSVENAGEFEAKERMGRSIWRIA